MEFENYDENEDLSQLDRGNDFTPDEEVDENNEVLEDEDEVEEIEEVEEEEEIEEEEEVEEVFSKNQKIPKARLDKALSQRDEYKERNAWLEEQLLKLIEKSTTPETKTPIKESLPEYDFESAEQQYADLLVEGKLQEAVKLKREIDKQHKLEFEAKLQEIRDSVLKEATSKSTAEIENEKFSVLRDSVENKYPFLNADSDDYNEEAVDTVNALMAGFLAKGMTKTQALSKSVEKIAPMYVKEQPKPKEKKGSTRTTEAGKKAAAASNSQPPKTKASTTTSINTQQVNVRKLSEKDFSKLTLAERKLLRGD